jgi:two-component system LytT family response regulator
MEPKIKAIIIEDEVRAQIYLKGVLEKVAPNMEVLAICDDLPSGVIAIRKQKPDLVFLDIEMPKFNGLEITNFFAPNEINFAIIFTTAYNQYAIRAFKLSAIDYLLKPIDPNELKETLQRFDLRRKTEASQLIKVKEILNDEVKIAIPDGNNFIMLMPSEISFLKADSNYTQVVLTNEKKILTSRLLRNFEETLKEIPYFFRCHKSYIVNLNEMISYQKSDGGIIILKNKMEIPVSSDKVEELLSKFVKVNR